MDNTKKLGIILSVVVFILTFIVGFYFVTDLFKVQDLNITTTTKPVKIERWKNLTTNEVEKYTALFNDENLIIMFNNAFDNYFEMIDVDLFEKEDSKFKFIYTYLSLNEISNEINLDLINEYSIKFFNTELYGPNFDGYLNEAGFYEYEIKYNEITYCLKPVSKDKDIILLHKILIENCDKEFDEELIDKKIEIRLKENNDEYVYESFVINKEEE